jgi:hypothetical protein
VSARDVSELDQFEPLRVVYGRKELQHRRSLRVRVANTQTASPMSGVCYVQPTPTLRFQAQVQAWIAFRAPSTPAHFWSRMY